jgi:hypothetical protein
MYRQCPLLSLSPPPSSGHMKEGWVIQWLLQYKCVILPLLITHAITLSYHHQKNTSSSPSKGYSQQDPYAENPDPYSYSEPPSSGNHMNSSNDGGAPSEYAAPVSTLSPLSHHYPATVAIHSLPIATAIMAIAALPPRASPVLSLRHSFFPILVHHHN